MSFSNILIIVISVLAVAAYIYSFISTMKTAESIREVNEAIQEMEKSGDLELVTRCKNCQYAKNNHGDLFCNKWETDVVIYVYPNDYCSMEKPKEESHGMDKM